MPRFSDACLFGWVECRRNGRSRGRTLRKRVEEAERMRLGSGEGGVGLGFEGAMSEGSELKACVSRTYRLRS